jgi:hypothetical protein
VACESGLMHEAAQIISDVGLVYEAVLCHGVDSLFSASLILGVVSLPCCAGIALATCDSSAVGAWGKQPPSVVYPAHPWVVCGQRFHPAAGNGAVFAVEIVSCGTDVRCAAGRALTTLVGRPAFYCTVHICTIRLILSAQPHHT